MRYRFNPFLDPAVRFEPADPAVGEFHASIPGYQPTPLHSSSGLARTLGVRNLYVKDQSHRFGLNAFKVLGICWAMHRMLAAGAGEHPTFVCATDGSHGRAVAWAARGAGAKAVIYVPRETVPARVEAIRKLRRRTEGYRTLFIEADKQIAERSWAPPELVILQAYALPSRPPARCISGNATAASVPLLHVFSR